MAELIVCMTDQTGNKHLRNLIEKNEWEKVFLICNQEMAENFDSYKELNIIVVEPSKKTEDIKKQVISNLKNNISGLEVALNFFSGKGKEHMAIVASLIELGIGFRLVKQGENHFEEL